LHPYEYDPQVVERLQRRSPDAVDDMSQVGNGLSKLGGDMLSSNGEGIKGAVKGVANFLDTAGGQIENVMHSGAKLMKGMVN